MNTYTEDLSLGQIVIDNPLTARLFHEAGLDFCCGGKTSLKEACERKKLSTEDILKKLEVFTSSTGELQISEHTRGSEIINYILKRFHDVHKEETPTLTFLANKVARVHGKAHPELHRINTLFADLIAEIEPHMMKEERVLFPLIQAMDEANANGTPFEPFHCGSVNNPMGQMEMEHETVGQILREIREATNNFNLPEGACNSYRALYAGLEKFEYDLHLHIHYENNALHPLARKLEEELQ